MPRLFTGIKIPREIATELAVLRGGLPGARWIDPEDFHITLRFIGDIGLSMANDIASELASIRSRRVTAVVDALGVFGGDRPRAVIAKVVASDPLCALQGEHERLLRRIGVAPEKRKFTPHVTLARLRGVGVDNVAAWIESRSGSCSLAFPVERFALFSSRESTGGGPYKVEADYPL